MAYVRYAVHTLRYSTPGTSCTRHSIYTVLDDGDDDTDADADAGSSHLDAKPYYTSLRYRNAPFRAHAWLSHGRLPGSTMDEDVLRGYVANTGLPILDVFPGTVIINNDT